MIIVVDYGMSNLHSVAKALRAAEAHDVTVTSNAQRLKNASHIILPGQGAFPDGIKNLNRLGFIPILREEVLGKKKPFLGICLGMQLLASIGFENGKNRGLDFIAGESKQLPINPTEYKLPHIGWDDVVYKETCSLFASLPQDPDFYFLQSFFLAPEDTGDVVAWCDYGIKFPVAIHYENIVAVLFHPEKSQRFGITLLRNFLHLKPEVC